MSAEIPAIGQEGLIYDKVFRVMQTVGEMMRDRRYQIADRIIPNTFEEFKDMYTDVRDGVIYRERMTLPCERVGGAQRSRAMVFFTEGLSMELMKRYHSQAVEANCDRVILVAHGKVNATVKRHIDDLNRSSLSIKVQLFDEDDLVVNVTHHELVPKHTPLEEEEVKEMLQAHALDIGKLPRILSTDPVAAYFGLERGRVVKIERKSMSAGYYVTYRQVT